jgi:short-subunit dehydrogenase
MRKIIIFGATSSIAQHVARRFASLHNEFFIVGRSEEKILAVRNDLLTRGAAQVDFAIQDCCDIPRHRDLFERGIKSLGGCDLGMVTFGTLPDQKKCEASVSEALASLETNFMSVISLLTIMASFFEEQRKGSIAVISSVAGERGRRSNYVYGTAKGAITLFLQGLRARLHQSGVHVLTIKPGFVDTPMTAHFKKNSLFVDPETAGAAIYNAICFRRDIVYVPWFWRWIMLVLRLMPERYYKRLNL